MPTEVDMLEELVPVGPAMLLFADGEYVNDGADLLVPYVGIDGDETGVETGDEETIGTDGDVVGVTPVGDTKELLALNGYEGTIDPGLLGRLVLPAPVCVIVHVVYETGMRVLLTYVLLAGQFVTVSAQPITVTSLVEKIVEVEYETRVGWVTGVIGMLVPVGPTNELLLLPYGGTGAVFVIV